MTLSQAVKILYDEGYDEKDITHWQKNIACETTVLDMKKSDVIEDMNDFLLK